MRSLSVPQLGLRASDPRLLSVGQAERIAEIYLQTNPIAPEKHDDELPPCKLDIPMPICTEALKAAIANSEAEQAASVEADGQGNAEPMLRSAAQDDAETAAQQQETGTEQQEQAAQQEPKTDVDESQPTPEHEDAAVAAEAKLESTDGKSAAETGTPGNKVECPGFIVLGSYEATLNGTRGAPSDAAEPAGPPPPAPNGPSGAPPVEPAVPPSDTIDEVDELISTGSSGEVAQAESQTKRQRQEPGSRGRPWKQPARYIKYTPPPSHRLEWWERASRLPVSAPAPTQPAPEAQGAEAEGATAAAAPVVEVDQAGLLKAEIEESEEWHFRCVTTTAGLTGLVQS